MMNRNIDLKKNKTDVSPRNEILVESLEKFVSNYYTVYRVCFPMGKNSP